MSLRIAVTLAATIGAGDIGDDSGRGAAATWLGSTAIMRRARSW